MHKKTFCYSKNLISSTQVFFQNANLSVPGLQLVRVSRELWRPTFNIRCDHPQQVTVWSIVSGKGELACAGKTELLRPGMVFITRPDLNIAVNNDPKMPLEMVLVSFSGSEASDFLNTYIYFAFPLLPIQNSHAIHRMFACLYETAIEGGPVCEKVCKQLVGAILLTIQNGFFNQTELHSISQKHFSEYRQYIDEHFLEIETISDISDLFKISTTYLQRLFKKHLSINPNKYILERKIRFAAQQLQTTALTVKEIADELGFSDQYAFSKSFKRIIGKAPSHYRNRR
jgi:AraC-like DNA-binding protein